MASMLGHVLGAQAVLGPASRTGPAALRSRRAMWLAGAVAIIPDLDNPLAILLGRPDWLQHRGPSHSLLVFAVLAAVAATLCIWGALKPGESPAWAWLRAALAFALVGACHIALDWLMRVGPEMRLLWPFCNQALANSPVQLMPTATYSVGSWGSFFGVLGDWQTWVGALLELVIFVPLVLLAWGKAAGKLRWAMVGLASAGMAVTYILYQATTVI